MGAMRYFTFIVVLSIFYSFGVTLLSYTMIPFGISTLTIQPFQNQSTDIPDISTKIEAATRNQLNLPLIDMGALVFYSGNIIFDLLINFLTFLPGMFNLLIDGMCMLFNVPIFFAATLKVTIYVFLTVAYFIMLMQFLLSLRSTTEVV